MYQYHITYTVFYVETKIKSQMFEHNLQFILEFKKIRVLTFSVSEDFSFQSGLHVIDYCSNTLKICDIYLNKTKQVETCCN
jgi:hypothetical protein